MYLWIKLIPLSLLYTKSLLSASTTMNTTLSKGASGGCCTDPPCFTSSRSSSNSASPGMKGLYGKKPVAKISIATGISRFASTSSAVRDAIAAELGPQTYQLCQLLQERTLKERHEDAKKRR